MINTARLTSVRALEGARDPDHDGSSSSAGSPFAFLCLLCLLFIIYIAPQLYLQGLQPLRLALVSAILSIVAYVASVVAHGRRLTVWSSEIKLILWLVGFAILSIPLSKWPGGSFDFLFDSYLKSIAVLFLVANLLASEKRFRQLFWCISVFSAFNAWIGIKHYLDGDFLMYGRIAGGISGITSNSNDLALTLNLAIPFMWYLFTTSKSTISKWTAAAGLMSAVTGVIVTFSRGGLLTLIGIILWYVWTTPSKKRIPVVVGVALLSVVIGIFGPAGYTERVGSIVGTSKDDTGSIETRWLMTKGAVQNIIAHPLGVGLNMNNLALHEQGLGWNVVHNVYLEIATDLGILAGIVFIVLLWRLFSAMQRIRSLPSRPNDRVASLAEAAQGALLAFAIGALFHPVSYHFYFYIIAGIAVALKEMDARISHHAEFAGAEGRICAG